MCGLATNITSFKHLLKRVDFDALVDYLALAHIIKSKAEPTTTRIKRLFEILSSYSFNLYYMKGKDMTLSDFLSRQKYDNSNTLEIIPISFNMQGILQSRYYNLGEAKVGKYLVQMRSQAKSSSIKTTRSTWSRKGIRSKCTARKQVMKPMAATKVKEVSQIKLMLVQGRAGLRRKIKTPVSLLISKLITQVMEKPVEQPKVPVPRTSRIQGKFYQYLIMQLLI